MLRKFSFPPDFDSSHLVILLTDVQVIASCAARSLQKGAFLTIKVLKKGTSEKEKQSLVLAMFPTIAETRKLAICIQHIVAMKRGYGEKLLVGGDSVTLTSNLLACELTDVQK